MSHPTAPAPSTRRAMNISFMAGVLMLVVKWTAYLLTGSAAVFSDASETIVHIVAVGFAAYSLRVVYRPPDSTHHFGHDKIAFFSSGVEGVLIMVAGVVIIYEASMKWLYGLHLEKLDMGIALTAGAGAVNALLGWYLVRTGKQHQSLILVANGKHVLTDAWTSAGVIIGLSLAWATGIMWFDPLFAIAFALHIMYEGSGLVKTSIAGLMDATNLTLEHQVRVQLDEFCASHSISYHRLRLRESGARVFVDFHLQFPDAMPVGQAHSIASLIEQDIRTALDRPADVISHLENRHSIDHDAE